MNCRSKNPVCVQSQNLFCPNNCRANVTTLFKDENLIKGLNKLQFVLNWWDHTAVMLLNVWNIFQLSLKCYSLLCWGSLSLQMSTVNGYYFSAGGAYGHLKTRYWVREPAHWSSFTTWWSGTAFRPWPTLFSSRWRKKFRRCLKSSGVSSSSHSGSSELCLWLEFKNWNSDFFILPLHLPQSKI